MSKKKIVFEYIAYSDFTNPFSSFLGFIEQYNKYVDR